MVWLAAHFQDNNACTKRHPQEDGLRQRMSGTYMSTSTAAYPFPWNKLSMAGQQTLRPLTCSSSSALNSGCRSPKQWVASLGAAGRRRIGEVHIPTQSASFTNEGRRKLVSMASGKIQSQNLDLFAAKLGSCQVSIATNH